MIIDIILLLVAIILLVVAFKLVKSISALIINAVIGVVLFFITNAIGLTSIQVSVINLLVCAIGGIPGALILIVLNMLGIY